MSSLVPTSGFLYNCCRDPSSSFYLFYCLCVLPLLVFSPRSWTTRPLVAAFYPASQFVSKMITLSTTGNRLIRLASSQKQSSHSIWLPIRQQRILTTLQTHIILPSTFLQLRSHLEDPGPKELKREVRNRFSVPCVKQFSFCYLFLLLPLYPRL